MESLEPRTRNRTPLVLLLAFLLVGTVVAGALLVRPTASHLVGFSGPAVTPETEQNAEVFHPESAPAPIPGQAPEQPAPFPESPQPQPQPQPGSAPPPAGRVPPPEENNGEPQSVPVPIAEVPAPPPPPAPAPVEAAPAVIEPVVVAITDECFDPYHFDFLASQMPQATDAVTGNEYPLTVPPDQWLPNFPATSSFASFGPLPLTLPASGATLVDSLHTADLAQWNAMPQSFGNVIHMRWIPGTKVIGFVNMGDPACPDGFGGPATCGGPCHGTGATSAAVGNLFGSCPECLFVFVNGLSDDATNWVSSQSWIDVQSNSWGCSHGDITGTTPVRGNTNCWQDMTGRQLPSQRGQTTFFSAGNGYVNAFDAPQTTLSSYNAGPDWIVTVGAVTAEGDPFTGSGKPVDIASVGIDYPTSYGATTASNGNDFSGTSNASPVAAGLYARALFKVRAQMGGVSSAQNNGIVSFGAAACAAANPSCAAGNGLVTAKELREAFFLAANQTGTGYADGATQVPAAPLDAEDYFMTEGHGTYMGRIGGLANLDAETQAIVGAVFGNWVPTPITGETDWFILDSQCRQDAWVSWTDGDYNPTVTPPAPDPLWPKRTALYTDCGDTWYWASF